MACLLRPCSRYAESRRRVPITGTKKSSELGSRQTVHGGYGRFMSFRLGSLNIILLGKTILIPGLGE